MLTRAAGEPGERVLTARIVEPVLGAGLVAALDTVLAEAERAGTENLVLEFSPGPGAVTGDFPSFRPGPARPDMRYFARWDELLGRLSRARVKTFAAYDGWVGAAAVEAGLVMDLRLAAATARLSVGSLAGGRFPGLGAHWLPKFVGLGQARRILLLGADLTAEQAARLGLVDVVADSVAEAATTTVKAMRLVTPEAACFTRRILDDCYRQEHAAAVELAKAARYKVGVPDHDD
jgi:isomerase DpgB